MKTAKAKTKQTADRLTVEQARRAFSDSAEAITATYVFRLRHAWEAVAINLETIEDLHRAGKSWDDIGAMLGQACGFEAIAGQSIRVYRSRLTSPKGYYDKKLSRLGLRREEKALLPLVAKDQPANVAETGDRPPDGPAVTEADPRPDERVATDAKEPNSKISAGTTVPRNQNADGSSSTSSAVTRGRYALKSHPE
ncbi:MAG: hypothetical protein DI537_02380 [Stutzerimonas stutzeri]|nr:MAG: hypothetical protein DI537_02380 [Stutzerimonas stutzeri]